MYCFKAKFMEPNDVQMSVQIEAAHKESVETKALVRWETAFRYLILSFVEPRW